MRKTIIHDGHKFTRTTKYSWRDGNPDIDTDNEDRPVQWNYITIVKVSDCPKRQEGDKTIYTVTKEVPQAVRLFYVATNQGYTRYKKVKTTCQPRFFGGDLRYEWWESQDFLVVDGDVYVRSHRRADKPVDRICA